MSRPLIQPATRLREIDRHTMWSRYVILIMVGGTELLASQWLVEWNDRRPEVFLASWVVVLGLGMMGWGCREAMWKRDPDWGWTWVSVGGLLISGTQIFLVWFELQTAMGVYPEFAMVAIIRRFARTIFSLMICLGLPATLASYYSLGKPSYHRVWIWGGMGLGFCCYLASVLLVWVVYPM